MVECGFSEFGLEAEWNAFYSGPKLAALLEGVPGFRRSQRFRLVGDSPAPYLAIHEVDSLEILTNITYSGAGGGSFLQWQSYITNWRRTFFSGLEYLREVRPDERLLAIDGEPRRVSAARFDWLHAAGLGNLVPTRGLSIVSVGTVEQVRAEFGAPAHVFEPISTQMLASS